MMGTKTGGLHCSNVGGLHCMSTSQKYRRFAQECMEMARSFKDEGTRATLLLMAQVWSRLAEEKVSSGTDEKV